MRRNARERVIEFDQPTRLVVLAGFRRSFDARMRRMEPTLSAALSEISLPDTSGHRTRLGSLWAERPAIVVFLRHYG
jgi:hypothetical protein